MENICELIANAYIIILLFLRYYRGFAARNEIFRGVGQLNAIIIRSRFSTFNDFKGTLSMRKRSNICYLLTTIYNLEQKR